MDKFATLEPVRLYASTTSARLFSGNSNSNKIPKIVPVIGRLPVDLHQLILSYLPIPDIPAYARTSRALNSLVKEDVFWAGRWDALGVEKGDLGLGLAEVLDGLEESRKSEVGVRKGGVPPVLDVADVDVVDGFDGDEFGEFATVAVQDEMGDFVGASSPVPPYRSNMNVNLKNNTATAFDVYISSAQPTKKQLYMRAHSLLKPLAHTLSTSPSHLVLPSLSAFFSTLLPSPPTSANLLSPTPTSNAPVSPVPASHLTQTQEQTQTLHTLTLAKTLYLLAHFLSSSVQPLRAWPALASALRAAMDRFDAGMLAAFDSADGKGDEWGMREAADASWIVWVAAGKEEVGRRVSDWEMGKVWAEKREIFYVQGQWDPLDNFTKENGLDFRGMDAFISFVCQAIEEHGARAVRVFPPEAQVLVSFAERIAGEVVGEYISTLLTHARSLSSSSGQGESSAMFLQATAASFKEAWRMVDAVMRAGKARSGGVENGIGKNRGRGETDKEEKKKEKPVLVVEKTRAEDIVERYQMFEPNMDEYLDEEVDMVKHALEGVCKTWERSLSSTGLLSSNPTSTPSSTGTSTSNGAARSHSTHQPRFLTSSNPAQMKRTVLASFTSALLRPVAIVPIVGGAVGQGLAMLNPGRWVAQSGGSAGTTNGGVVGYKNPESGNGEIEGGMVFEVGEEEDEGEGEGEKKKNERGEEEDPWAVRDGETANEDAKGMHGPTSSTSSSHRPTRSSTPNTITTGTPSTSATAANTQTLELELLLSLDVALELIHADREALKRVETFAGYPGHYGHRVRDTVEEVFVLMLSALGEEHLKVGFRRAIEQMAAYKPAEHEGTTSVAPLMQFFELVHIGDTIQSMVQVYFDKEMAQHIDRTDFLNAVVREKKRFENALDDSVAGGLNAGTELLMNQVEHIIITRTKPREYYPPEDSGPLDLGPTKGCVEAIQCLEMHCQLLKGSTSKEVLEVFYQEVGIRLIAILQKHIKRQIISLNGGFQVIADLNTYHTFISSLKVPSIASEFSHLKMLGHVYVVEDAKDLAQIVRDVTRYGGAYRPEDIYEFIQRRSDWKKIEKTVDKTMYNLSFKEDCVIC